MRHLADEVAGGIDDHDGRAVRCSQMGKNLRLDKLGLAALGHKERPALIAHPAIPYSAVLTIERRVSREGMVLVGGNLCSVPDATRKRVLDVQSHPKEIRIFEDGALVAAHPVLGGVNGVVAAGGIGRLSEHLDEP